MDHRRRTANRSLQAKAALCRDGNSGTAKLLLSRRKASLRKLPQHFVRLDDTNGAMCVV
jgi:hypothetical protein